MLLVLLFHIVLDHQCYDYDDEAGAAVGGTGGFGAAAMDGLAVDGSEATLRFMVGRLRQALGRADAARAWAEKESGELRARNAELLTRFRNAKAAR